VHLACGRDPNFPPWSDTVHLNFANLEGLYRKWSLYLLRRREEKPDPEGAAFYERLIEVIGNPLTTLALVTMSSSIPFPTTLTCCGSDKKR
jgi:hypothetical protein